MTVLRSDFPQACVQSVLSRFLNPATAEQVSQQVVQDLITNVSRDQLVSRLQSRLAVSGITVSEEQLHLWLDRIVCSQQITPSHSNAVMAPKPSHDNPMIQNQLHPVVAEKADDLIRLSRDQGFQIRMIAGWRSFADQDVLYASDAGVTNARGGESFHNYGLAFDVAFVDERGVISFDDRHNWQAIGALGKSLGLTWGGDFQSIKDLGHFEWHPRHDLRQIQDLYKMDGQDGILKLSQ